MAAARGNAAAIFLPKTRYNLPFFQPSPTCASLFKL